MSEFRNTLILLRFPFSLFLLPTSLFSFYFIDPEANLTLLLVILIWHLLVFPSSNGYNSYHDQDDSPIGGLANPPKVSKTLLKAANFLDGLAIFLSYLINPAFALFVTIYIIFSRLYSNRKIRLKKFPLSGFLVVFFFQGAWVFIANFIAFNKLNLLFAPPVQYAALASSFLVGTMYPLTQIYQHEDDEKDQVKTMSMVLGKRGTFMFSGSLFSCAVLMLYLTFSEKGELHHFWLFNIIMAPVTLFFLYWSAKSFKNEKFVNFKNTMIMLIGSSVLNSIYFLLISLNLFEHLF